MHVLLTNDDGIGAPWLAALAGAFARAGHATSVLAPTTDQSGTSGALQPVPIGGAVDITLRAVSGVPADRAWGAEGATPSVCVVLALRGVLDGQAGPVDLVVSGPNYGWNIGRDVWRSGTAWAAITAWGMGVPALAVSGAPVAHHPWDLDALVARTVTCGEELAATAGPELWNLNLPAPPAHAWKPAEWTTMAPAERLTDSVVSVRAQGVDGGCTVRISQRPGVEVPTTPGSDSERVRSGGVSLSRLRPVEALM